MSIIEIISFFAFVLGVGIRDHYERRAIRNLKARVDNLERPLLAKAKLRIPRDNNGTEEFVPTMIPAMTDREVDTGVVFIVDDKKFADGGIVENMRPYLVGE